MSVIQREHIEVYSKFYGGTMIFCFQWQKKECTVNGGNGFSQYTNITINEPTICGFTGDSVC